jgi:hypothetical protein
MSTGHNRNGGDFGRVQVIRLDLPPQSKFELGEIVITRNAMATLSVRDVLTGIWRHAVGDWGDLDRFDRRLMEVALIEGGRLLSAYRSSSGVPFWIITEWDRSQTTILLPEDY